MNRYKHPRIYHLPFSGHLGNDDKFHSNPEIFNTIETVVTLKLDGENCVSEDTLILTDKGDIKIKDICENNLRPIIVSYNVETGEIEHDIVLNSIITENNQQWYEIELEDGSILTVTENHYVFLPNLNCYRRVKNLIIGDILQKR